MREADRAEGHGFIRAVAGRPHTPAPLPVGGESSPDDADCRLVRKRHDGDGETAELEGGAVECA